MEETWKVIDGYENYEVSNLGRVMSLKYHRGNRKVILKQSINAYGYPVVSLSKNGKSAPIAVHRLVATAFIPNPNNLPQVNHKDECKTNNAVWNLEWCDVSYNVSYTVGRPVVAVKTEL